ncbi:hypothetical protein [Blastococcus goldschmidtiae]|uniref:Uncharacterized protein n=1 Tax=Blastococcus goldschmidtiae TaxID=3075546 RepID=A0ABU2K638_9ACTN|nr:hypothetical protein [Blastococcus sp. DSM 46792]MDT0275665.1 hypothetical protein [Blastococcus sp. DSM 46792]
MRSVEAASRDDAIAAAREQFGPAARVVGVRRVRSGGVLGFFATERYVAEVAPDPYGVPGVPVPAPARPAGALTEDPDTGSLAAFGSPLASAAPARARTAPPRNGAAAWAAEAARTSAPAARATPRATPAPAGATVGRRVEAPVPRSEPADDARVDELAGLLAGAATPPRQPAVASRPGVAPASFARATRERPVPGVGDDAPGNGRGDDEAPATGAPSPFTAALARMVAGDRDVQHAVREALETSDALRSGEAHSGGRAVRPEPQSEPPPAPEHDIGPEPTNQPAVWSRVPRQKEETVGDQVIAPPSTTFEERTESLTWEDGASFPDESFADAPYVGRPVTSGTSIAELPAAVPPPASREEAIAEVLRAALAEGHSDDALAGILRRVVAGDSPQTALVEPAVAAADDVPSSPVVELPEAEAPVAELPEAEAPVAEVPEMEVPVTELPEAELPVVEALVVEALVADASSSVSAAGSNADLFAPVGHAATPAPVPAAATPVEVAPVSLWGEVAPAPVANIRAEEPAVAIWAPATPAQPAPVTELPSPLVDAPAVGTSLFGEAAAADTGVGRPGLDELAAVPAAGTQTVAVEPARTGSPVMESPLTESPTAESAATESAAVEAGIGMDLEVAPVLARTASDPAPVGRSMTMDETTVMPPLSLLPGSPSRGRGLPPVPPRTGRPSVPASRSRIPAGSSAGPIAPSTTGGDDVPPSSGRTSGLLATVTRLPVAPLMATPETPDRPDLADLADLMEADGSGLLGAVDLPAVVPARPARVRIDPPSTPAEVVSRLAALGVPSDLLGPAFTTDVAADGTYAALTRALGARLPEAPELPTGAGDVLFVVGPGVETLRAARSLAATLRLDPDRVQWATRGDLVGLSPEASRMSTIDTALRRRQDAATSGTVTIVAVDAPLRSDAYWMAQMLAIWSPVAVWAVVEATRKPEDLEHWLDGLSRVDALIVQDTDLSADPAAVLDRLDAPVAVVDGLRATPHRWASVLCERLESAPA